VSGSISMLRLIVRLVVVLSLDLSEELISLTRARHDRDSNFTTDLSSYP